MSRPLGTRWADETFAFSSLEGAVVFHPCANCDNGCVLRRRENDEVVLQYNTCEPDAALTADLECSAPSASLFLLSLVPNSAIVALVVGVLLVVALLVVCKKNKSQATS